MERWKACIVRMIKTRTRAFSSLLLVVTSMRVFEGGRRINERASERASEERRSSIFYLPLSFNTRIVVPWPAHMDHGFSTFRSFFARRRYFTYLRCIYVRPTQSSGFPRQSSLAPKKRPYSNGSAFRVQPYEEFIPFRWNFPKENGLTCPVSARTRASFHFF